MKRTDLRPLLAALSLLLAGCSSGSDLSSSSMPPTSSGGTVSIVMKSLDFNPISAHARVGQTVTWTNDDQAPHNVTYISGPRFRSSPRVMAIGKTFSIHLSQPGTIHYICTLHSWMHATIVVSG